MPDGAPTIRQPKTAVLFPGQGSQRPGMARLLLECSPAARTTLAEVSEILGRDMVALVAAPDVEEAELARPAVAHLALVCTGLACWRALIAERGIRPAMLAGHSLGEITALACAGALPIDQALALARRRGDLLELAVGEHPGGMTAIIGLPVDEVESACVEATPHGLVRAVNYNAPEQTVIAGEPEAIEAAAALCRARGAQAAPLRTAAAFHTPLVAGAAGPLHDFARSLDWREPAIPVLSSRTGRPHGGPEGMAVALALQLASPVLWTATLGFLLRAGVQRIISVSPASALNRLTAATLTGIEAIAWDAMWPAIQLEGAPS